MGISRRDRTQERRRYRSLRGLARWAVAALGLAIVASAAVVILDATALAASDDDLDRALERYEAGGWFGLAYLPAVVLFLAWLYRAYGNLPMLGLERRFRRSWAIAAWFIPVLWFWRPWQIVREIDASGGHASRRLVDTWWALWLLVFALSLPVLDLYFGTVDSRMELRRVLFWEIPTFALDLPLGVLAILVVLRLSTAQERRGATLGDDHLSTAPEPPS